MTAQEVIFFTPKDKSKWEAALNESLRRVILSLPFEPNYQDIKDKNALITSLFLQKIPVILFNLFAEERNLKIENHETLFWLKTDWDFKYEKWVIRIVNQTVNSGINLSSEQYLFLPALIPNRFEGDTWDQIQEIPKGMDGNMAVFTFMTDSKNFGIPAIEISTSILDFLDAVAKKYGEYQAEVEPFSQDDFWVALAKKGELPQISVSKIPTLVITGAARNSEFKFFADTDDKTHHGYRLYQGEWYEIQSSGGLSFCNGLIKTQIKNATCPIQALVSIESIFPKGNQ